MYGTATGLDRFQDGDRTISMPDEAHPFLAALLCTDGPFRRAEVPGLDEESSRVVIGRLLDEGILVAAPEARGGAAT